MHPYAMEGALTLLVVLLMTPIVWISGCFNSFFVLHVKSVPRISSITPPRDPILLNRCISPFPFGNASHDEQLVLSAALHLPRSQSSQLVSSFSLDVKDDTNRPTGHELQ